MNPIVASDTSDHERRPHDPNHGQPWFPDYGCHACLCPACYDPDPRTHAERDAAQLGDEMECIPCANCGHTDHINDEVAQETGYYPCMRRACSCDDWQAPEDPEILAQLEYLDPELYTEKFRGEHTHPCPTCRHDRSCACTTFTPGEPLECATCSNCRGW